MNKRTTTLLTLLMLLLQSNDTFSMETQKESGPSQIKKKSGLSQKERKAALALEKAKRAAELAQAAVEAAETAPASTPLPPKPPLVPIAAAATWPADAQTTASADNEDTTDSESSNDEDGNLQQPDVVATAGAASADNEVNELAQATDNLTLNDADAADSNANEAEAQAAAIKAQVAAAMEVRAASFALIKKFKPESLKHQTPPVRPVAITKEEYISSENYPKFLTTLIKHWKSYGVKRNVGLRPSYEDYAFSLLANIKYTDKEQMARDLQYAVKAIRKAIQEETPDTLTLHSIPQALDKQDDTIHALQTLLAMARCRQLDVDPKTLRRANEVMQIHDGLSKRLASLASTRAQKSLYSNKQERKQVKNDLLTQGKDVDLSDDEYENVGIRSGEKFVTADWAKAPVNLADHV